MIGFLVLYLMGVIGMATLLLWDGLISRANSRQYGYPKDRFNMLEAMGLVLFWPIALILWAMAE